MALLHVRPRRFLRDEYYRLAESGILDPHERVELIDGTIVVMSPQNLPHSTSVRLTNMVLTGLFRDTHVVSCQAPISLGDDCEPEPDFALLTPAHMQECLRQGSQPTRPDLVLEIADTSLRYDRTEKASLYARAGIPEYWVLDLDSRRLEVRRDPGPESDAVFGHEYRLLRVVHEGERIAPAFAPAGFLSITDLLPPLEP